MIRTLGTIRTRNVVIRTLRITVFCTNFSRRRAIRIRSLLTIRGAQAALTVPARFTIGIGRAAAHAFFADGAIFLRRTFYFNFDALAAGLTARFTVRFQRITVAAGFARFVP